ncbi:MAG TPA: class I SAM-dependent methyltransferase [Bacteroidia bacterium]|nr:class I SAM-dependent methyltransferase [Bacteroidia bacterium]
MTNIQSAYNQWAEQYDSNKNRTRDLEATALRKSLGNFSFRNCLEIGCGTGKNTVWLEQRVEKMLAVDLSSDMLKKAAMKIQKTHVHFAQADILKDWQFAGNEKFDLVVFSLVLEHIENLDRVFEKLALVTSNNALVYIGELHPFKQYLGTKARFENENGIQEVTCYIHHLSDFVHSARKHHFTLTDIEEYFDEEDKQGVPRILRLLFRK